MRHGSLFSGIGGFDLAAEWMGWENVFHCEWMEFPRKVLDYHFPNADSHIDICKTDFKKYANRVDILTGGFPCQPFSLAGKRKGTEDERYLWGEMLRAIQEIKPKFVIAENVFGITNIDGGLVFEQVCLDLEAEGYEVQPFIIPAASKNAPHRRDRCWFIGVRNATDTNGNDGRSTDRKSRCEESKTNGEGQQPIHSRIGATSNEGNATDTNCNGLNQRNSHNEINASQGGKYAFSNAEQGNVIGDATNTKSKSNGWKLQQRQEQRQFRGCNSKNNVTNTDIREQEQSAFNSGMGRFGESIKEDCWSLFPTQSPICGGDDGLPSELDGITFSKWRAESIKGYGNAIVPQIALELFKIIETI